MGDGMAPGGAGGRRDLSRRDFLLASAGAGAGLYLGFANRGLVSAAGAQTPPPNAPEIFTAGWPRNFFFRQTEYEARDEAIFGGNGRPTTPLVYEDWAKRFLPLGGIMGKVLNEEHDFSDKKNLEWFVRFKQENPTKAVFLHYNGTGRRPTDQAAGPNARFFPGHFLHYRGTSLTQPARATRNTITLHVADTSVFKLNRSQGVNDDIAVTLRGAGGRPDWNRVEQVRLRGINAAAKTITVQRGAYGTRLMAFPVGSYLAAHVVVGPYAQAGIAGETVALWAYNLSLNGPRDNRRDNEFPNGRNGIDALVQYLKETFTGVREPNLSSFDGISIDILFFALRASQGNLVDTNGDGRADGGLINGVDVWGPGQTTFIEELRKVLSDKIIMSDGQFPFESQRSFGQLNGIEAEGYPDLWDDSLAKLSQGSNSFAFWNAAAKATDEASEPPGDFPTMSYVNYKFKDQFGAKTPRNTFKEPNLREDKSYKKLRLTLASALFTDTFFTNAGDWRTEGRWAPPEVQLNTDPPGDPLVTSPIFDEYWRGVDQVPNWLGNPVGPAISLATAQPDLLNGQGDTGATTPWSMPFTQSFNGTQVAFYPAPPGQPGMQVRNTANNTGPVLRRFTNFSLPGKITLSAGETDLYVTLRLRADQLPRYAPYVARRVYVTATPVGPGAPQRATVESFTWANGTSFDASFNFRNVGPGPVRLDFRVEGDTDIYLERLTAHAAPDAVYREYDNGAVFANASNEPFNFNLGEILPGKQYRRIEGRPEQANVPDNPQDPPDPSRQVNTGLEIGATLTIPGRDALLVVRTTAAP
jgi:hypothetical protein